MDKKKLFQKQLLQSQIDEHTVTLSKLQITYDSLKLQTTDDTHNVTININVLLDQIKHLENIKKLNKNKISDIQSCISKLEEKLKYYPDTIKDKIETENTIYNDEIERINNDKIEIKNNNIENLNSATIDKDNLIKEIDLVKSNIQNQTSIINNIQQLCHSSRKNLLTSLKEQKQLKLIVNNNINNLNITSTVFIQNIQHLELDILKLLEFKKLLVDAEYNINHNITKLTDYYSEYNIDMNLILNDKLSLIENLIIKKKETLLSLQKQKQKTDTINQLQITEHLNTYNTTINNKVLTYKDKFKIEKEKKKILETNLADKLNLYNNYETLVIDKINNIYKLQLQELERDFINASDRLNITKKRINLENETNKANLKAKLDSNYLELQHLHLEIVNATNDIKLLNVQLEKVNSINTELSILENKMKKHKDIIMQSDKDLLLLK
jgi:hypothetical protein